jgi:predicted small integral membrane protein
MFWSWQSGLFFFLIFSAIAFLGFMHNFSPNVDRKGFFPMETGRGDRLFIGVYSTFVIFLLSFIVFSGSFITATVIVSVVWFIVEFKWG